MIASEPLTVCLLVLPGSSLLTVASAMDPLRATNRFTNGQSFRWQVQSLNGDPVPLSCGFDLPVNGPFQPTRERDVLALIAGFNAMDHDTPQVRRQLQAAWPVQHTVLALEAASWLLAQADLVRSEPITTHWEDLEDFETAYPALDVRTDRYTIGRKLCSAGGASPTFDMLLDLIQRWRGYPLAMQVAGAFIYDQARAASETQSHASHERLEQFDSRVARAIRAMEQSIDQPISVAALARRVGMSSRGLEYAFARSIGQTPGAYYLNIRLQRAARLAQDTGLPFQEIAIRCGFGSQSAFARAFKQKFGRSPSNLRQPFGRT